MIAPKLPSMRRIIMGLTISEHAMSDVCENLESQRLAVIGGGEARKRDAKT